MPKPKSPPKRKPRRIGRPAGGNGRDTEARILNAAEQLFAARGFVGCRTGDVADAAGVTRAMIHYYFDSKERLYQAVLDRILFELIKLVQQASGEQSDRASLLRQFVTGFFDYVARHPHFGRLTYMGGDTVNRYFDHIVKTFFRPMFTRGVQFIAEGIAEGTFREVDPRQYLLSIYACTMGYFADAHFVSSLLEADALTSRRVTARRRAVLDMACATLGIPSEGAAAS